MTARPHLLAAAALLAGRGRYPLALAVLDALPADPDPLPSALLRAKIFAQMGRYSDALGEWRAVLAAVPDHREAAAGVRLAERLRARHGDGKSPRRFPLQALVGWFSSSPPAAPPDPVPAEL